MERKMKTESKEQLMKFIEAIVYILSIIVVVFANVYGNIYFRFIPLLFILGIIGNIAFKRTVTTTVFGMIICICTMYLNGTRNMAENLFNSSILSINIALGEVFSSSLMKYIGYIKENRKNKIKDETSIETHVKYLSLPVLLFFFFLAGYNYINSNIFELSLSKKRLDSYLTSSNIDYSITDITFNITPKRNFKFRVYDNNDLRSYDYIVYTNKKLEIKDVQDNNINNKILNYNKEIEKIISGLNVKDINVKVIYENSEYVIEFSKNVNNINNNVIKDYSMQISNIIENEDFDKILKQVSRVLLELKSNEDTSKNIASYFYVENYYKTKNTNLTKTYSYINDSLTVEYID